jgi:hypothetical protein
MITLALALAEEGMSKLHGGVGEERRITQPRGAWCALI